ncbi:MAG TPA: acyl carrier protein, partial [Vicinamibacterales bacterium]
DQFFEQLAEILDEETVSADDVLRDFDQWDSLSALSVLAMCDSKYGVTLESEELARAKTAGELRDVVAAKRK